MPSETASNGRDTNGKFVAGNKVAKGNPFAKRMGQLKSAMLKQIKEEDIEKIIQTMINLATEGKDVAAAKLILNYAVGIPRDNEPIDLNVKFDNYSNLTDKEVQDLLKKELQERDLRLKKHESE